MQFGLLLCIICSGLLQTPAACFLGLSRNVLLSNHSSNHGTRCYFNVQSKAQNKQLHTHTRLTALRPRLPRWAGTRKVEPIWILLKQATVSGSGISCTQHPTTQFFTARMHFLPPNQQCQSTEGKEQTTKKVEKLKNYKVKKTAMLRSIGKQSGESVESEGNC